VNVDILTPEDQIRNVMASIRRLLNGPSHPGRMHAIKAASHQLDEMLTAYFRGELQPIERELPF